MSPQKVVEKFAGAGGLRILDDETETVKQRNNSAI
jgi:hypothetical protein